jgi:hypothetical protein
VKPEHIVAVVLRLFAIVLTIYTVNSFVGSAWFYFASGATTGVSVLLVVVTLVMLATAVLLWRFPLWIASRLIGFDSSVSRASISIPADELQTVAFTVVGIYLLFKAVVSGVYWVSWYGARGQAYAIDPREWASMLTTIAEFVLACFLVFGAEKLGEVISKVRRLGTN